jgi:hypothetical protein
VVPGWSRLASSVVRSADQRAVGFGHPPPLLDGDRVPRPGGDDRSPPADTTRLFPVTTRGRSGTTAAADPDVDLPRRRWGRGMCPRPNGRVRPARRRRVADMLATGLLVVGLGLGQRSSALTLQGVGPVAWLVTANPTTVTGWVMACRARPPDGLGGVHLVAGRHPAVGFATRAWSRHSDARAGSYPALAARCPAARHPPSCIWQPCPLSRADPT